MKAKPILVDELRQLVRGCPATLRGTRDRCVLVLGFGASLTRSELARLELGDLEVEPGGVRVRVRGDSITVPASSNAEFCPVRAVSAWLAVSGITQGRLFRAVGAAGRLRTPKRKDAGKLITRIVKRAAARAGMDPSLYSAHSLRCGIAASMPVGTVHVAQVHGRWKTRRAVARYARKEG